MSSFSTFSSFSATEFFEFFVLVYGNEKLSDEEIEFLKVLNQLNFSSSSQIQALKDLGNNLFRQHQFDQAGDCYDKACRLLSSSLRAKNSLDLNAILPLAVSLCLNLAACANKLQAPEVAMTYCSMILNFFPRHAKALFRKAAALKTLDRLSEACSTLEEAMSIEPNNKDITHELEDIKRSLVINKNGKRVVMDSLAADDARAGKLFVSSLHNPEKVSSTQPQFAEVAEKITESVTNASSLCSEVEATGKMTFSYSASSPAVCHISSSPDEPMVSDSGTVTDETSNDTQVCNSSSSPTTKSPHFSFTNQKRSHNTLHLSSQDYENLIHGTTLGFYHPRSMSFMRVRPLISKTIQTGTPHDVVHGTAEVPNTSPPRESFSHVSNVDQPKNDALVKEEIDVQVDKKTRLNSDSPYPTKISSVHFEFAAVRDVSLTTVSKDRSLTKGFTGRATATSKKRSMLSVSFCRYTRSTIAIMRMKRKGVHFIEFDAHYHPPFKKSRLVSSLETTCTVSSVTWVSSSFRFGSVPLFVL